MEIPDIGVLTLSGEKLSLKGDLNKVVEALRKDGCLLLKRATDLSTVEPILTNDRNSFGYVRKEIALNEAVKTILFAAQNDDFLITGYVPHRFGVQRGSVGRDSMWERMAKDTGLLGVCCTHLGKDENVSWIIEVYENYREKADESKVVTMQANGCDAFLCNTALQRWTPRLEKEPPAAAFAIVVYYFRRGYPERVKMISSPEVARELLLVAGEDCFESDEHVIWKRGTTSE